MGKKSRKPKTRVEELAAPPDAVTKIRELDQKRVNDEIEVTKTIENVALGMGLKREKGWAAWGYDVATGKFSRRSLPNQTSPST